ncbi:uncharacterized protein [Montipora capricornis]|uniref:uncharacterized protein n=1 Tax=Montipora capricornis TaxID=246305 RepID=UPI0035F174B4
MESLASLYDHGDDILHMCKKYDVSRPTVHEAMRDAETLDSILKSHSLSLVFQCRLVTAVANHPCFVPENPLNAEVQVNSLLPYLSSSCCWVRSLACSLTRVFASGLDKNGEHFETQVTIICKNLQSTCEESLTDIRFQLCQVISCSSLCYIAISCAEYLPVSAAKFVLLALQMVLKIVANPAKCTSAFVYQVGLDGLAKLLKSPSTWSVLSVLEKQDTVKMYLCVYLNQCSSEDNIVDDLTMARMLEVFDNTNVLDTFVNLPDPQGIGQLLKQLLELLAPVTPSSVSPLLDIRWKSLSIIYRLLQRLKNQDISHLDSLFDRACCDPKEVDKLRAMLTDSFTEFSLDTC